MKAYHFFTAPLLILFIVTNCSFAQNEIEKYRQPDLIEGRTFTVTASPSYSNKVSNDTTKHSTLILNFCAEFNEWKFSPKFNHALNFKMDFNLQRDKYKEYSLDTVFNISRGKMNFDGGLSYYPFNNPVYGGFYFTSRNVYEKSKKTTSNNDLYVFAGYGRFDDAGQVSINGNFEKILLEEGIIKTRLPKSTFRNLTELLDRRYNREFSARYKDDADIEFFSQIENLLLDEKIINNPLGARTILKLYQALTNTSYVYFPRYKGYMGQVELSYNNINLNSESSNSNYFSLIFSGIYGINIGLKTNLLLSCYLSLPLDKEKSMDVDNSFYHSPFTIKESFLPYPAMLYDIPGINKHDFITGVKVSAFHNFSNTAGISATSHFSFGKTENQKNDYTFNTRIRLRYNILSKLVMNTDVEFYSTNYVQSSFYSGIVLEYIIF